MSRLHKYESEKTKQRKAREFIEQLHDKYRGIITHSNEDDDADAAQKHYHHRMHAHAAGGGGGGDAMRSRRKRRKPPLYVRMQKDYEKEVVLPELRRQNRILNEREQQFKTRIDFGEIEAHEAAYLTHISPTKVQLNMTMPSQKTFIRNSLLRNDKLSQSPLQYSYTPSQKKYRSTYNYDRFPTRTQALPRHRHSDSSYPHLTRPHTHTHTHTQYHEHTPKSPMQRNKEEYYYKDEHEHDEEEEEEEEQEEDEEETHDETEEWVHKTFDMYSPNSTQHTSPVRRRR